MKKSVWIAVLLIFGLPLLAFGVSLIMPKKYSSSMGLLLDQTMRGVDNSPFATVDDLINFSRSRTIQTSIETLRGTEVLLKAVEKTQEKFPQQMAKSGGPGEVYLAALRSMRIDQQRESDVVSVTVTQDDPEVAAELANQIGYAFIDFTQRMAAEGGDAALQTISRQIDSTLDELSKIDLEISKGKSEARIGDIQTSGAQSARTFAEIEMKLDDAKRDYESSRKQLEGAEAALKTIPKYIDSQTSIRMNPELQDINLQLARLRGQRAGLLERYMEDHSIVQEIDKQIADYELQRSKLERNIEIGKEQSINSIWLQQTQIATGLRASTAALQRQLSIAEENLQRELNRLQSLPDAERKLIALSRKRLVLETNYTQLLQRKQQLEASGSARRSNARIVSTALPSPEPSSPNTRLMIVAGFGLGLGLAIIILFPRQPIQYGEIPASYPLQPATAGALPNAGGGSAPVVRDGGDGS